MIKTEEGNKSVPKQGEKSLVYKCRQRVKRPPSPANPTKILYIMVDLMHCMLILTVPCPFASK